MPINNTQIEAFALNLTTEIENLHIFAGFKPRSWSPLAGQAIVYGLERHLGFSGAADLEAHVERAWRAGKPIQPVIKTWYENFQKRV